MTTTSSHNKSKSDQSSMLVVLPGDNVTEFFPQTTTHNDDQDDHDTTLDHNKDGNNKVPSLKIGKGLRLDTSTHQIYATIAGKLRIEPPVAYVQHNSQRYPTPRRQDRVIGIIEDRIGSDPSTGGDLYRVNIQASHPATLNNLHFEGASKRNKPQFQPGQVVYARVMEVSTHQDAQLSCQLGPNDGNLPRKDWMTQEGVYGPLVGGTLTRIPTGLCQELLQPNNLVLQELAKHKQLQFELAIGINGYLWVNSRYAAHTILVQHAIANSQVLTEAQIISMVKSLVYTVAKELQKHIDQTEDMDEE